MHQANNILIQDYWRYFIDFPGVTDIDLVNLNEFVSKISIWIGRGWDRTDKYPFHELWHSLSHLWYYSTVNLQVGQGVLLIRPSDHCKLLYFAVFLAHQIPLNSAQFKHVNFSTTVRHTVGDAWRLKIITSEFCAPLGLKCSWEKYGLKIHYRTNNMENDSINHLLIVGK